MFDNYHTVSWWLEQLKAFPPDAKVVLATRTAAGALDVLDVSEGTGKWANIIFIDVGSKHD